MPVDLTTVLEDKGPFVSLYLPGPDATPDGKARTDLRWRNVRRDLEDDGVDATLLDAVEEATTGSPPAPGQTTAVIASADGGVRVQASVSDLDLDLVDHGPLPRIVPLVKWQRDHPPALVVIADHAGADVWEIDEGRIVATGEVAGETDGIHRGQPGGWSQRRFQQRAENLWEENARDVAHTVERLADEVSPRVVVAAGEPHSIHYLREHLGGVAAERLEVLDHGSRAPGSDPERILDEARTAVATVVAADQVALLERFAEERGQDDRAVDGPAATLAALSQAQVETLLVHDDPADERTAWFDDTGTQVAAEARTLRDLGIEPHEGRLVDVATRAALLTGAEVQPVPAHGPSSPTDGLGAILRYAR